MTVTPVEGGVLPLRTALPPKGPCATRGLAIRGESGRASGSTAIDSDPEVDVNALALLPEAAAPAACAWEVAAMPSTAQHLDLGLRLRLGFGGIDVRPLLRVEGYEPHARQHQSGGANETRSSEHPESSGRRCEAMTERRRSGPIEHFPMLSRNSLHIYYKRVRTRRDVAVV